MDRSMPELNLEIFYRDDLKFNRAIRVLFIKTIRKDILANYERYIVDVPERSSDIRQFDVVSYLSDQPEFMYSFLSKFLDTQLFASFIDENAKRMQQSWLSIFDMDPEELSDHFTDRALEQAFKAAQRIHLMDLREEQSGPDIEVKTVPASPMKLRRRVPGLASLASKLSFGGSKARNLRDSSAASIDIDTIQPTNNQDSPPIHRNSVATIPLQDHQSLSLSGNNGHSMMSSQSPASIHPSRIPANQPIPSGKIMELIKEVKDLTKSILIEKLGGCEPEEPVSGTKSNNSLKGNIAMVEEANGIPMKSNYNALVGSLCDLIDRESGRMAPSRPLHRTLVITHVIVYIIT